MATKVLLLTLTLLFHFAPSALAQCNGDPALCSKRFDEVCYATTHNAFNYQGAFLFPNQSFDITRQMQDGVRALMLDVYWYNNRPTVYHSSNFLGNQPLSNLLTGIKTFLDSNPDEVVSIIFECYITASQMNDVFTQSGLLSYVHAQPQGSAWPTLADMIATNRRLVVFTDATDGQAYPWYHHVWDYAVETDYTAYSRSDFSCAYNRGDSTNSLFILNHFVTQPSLGYGLIDSAAAVNANPYFTSRAMGCWAATGKLPNFLTVDFYEQGDVMATRDALNAGFVSGISPAPQSEFQLYPNPTTGSLHLQRAKAEPCTITVTDSKGSMLQTWQIEGYDADITLPTNMPNGLYTCSLQSETIHSHRKIILLR